MRLSSRLGQVVLVMTVIALAYASQARELPGLPVQTRPSPTAHVSAAQRLRVAVIVMENAEYGQIVGSKDTPYINSLARTYALATTMYAVSHPSLPNYLALTGGSTFGINSDCTGCHVDASSIVDQLERAGITWKAYMEGLPHSCFTGPGAGSYAKKHDPFVYYRGVAQNRTRCDRVVPLSQLSADERRGRLARFTWITPNLCHDMHDCSAATGDHFLARLIPGLLRALGSDGLMILTWDEGNTYDGCCRLASGGHVATILAGPAAARRARLSTPTDHYSVLQLIEDVFELPRLRGAACVCTTSLQPLVRGAASSTRPRRTT